MWDREEGDPELAQMTQRLRLPSGNPLTAALQKMKELEREQLAQIIEPAIRSKPKAQRNRS